MRKLLMILPIVGLLVFSGQTAGATQGDCATFENHSGHVPGSYDYAEFYEDGQLVTTVETNGEDVFVNPEGFDAGDSWDQVNKCDYQIEQPPSVTVDCLTLTVDAAEGQLVGVQIGDGFVEFEGSDSFVGEAGQAWAVYYNDQVLASGVFEECDTTTTTTINQETTSTESSSTTTIPVDTTTSIVTDTTTSSSFPVTSTTAPTDNTTTPELPFTGPAGMVGLLVAGLTALGIGTVLVRGFGSDEA